MKIVYLIISLLISISAVGAQTLPISTIDIYGLKTVTEAQVREALQIKEGETPAVDNAALEKRVAVLPNVAEVSISTICCDDLKHQRMMFIGIREKNVRPFVYRAAPQGKVRLPEEILQLNAQFDVATQKAVLQNDNGEDDSKGYALFNNSELRRVQLQFIPFVRDNFQLLHRVLHESGDAAHRAIAAEIIAYHPDQKAIVKDLVYAAGDGDETVRNNAIRALGVLAGYANNSPDKKIKIPYRPFIPMLNSVVWFDRNKSSLLWRELTAGRDPAMLKELRKNNLTALIEIARWKNPGHAMSAFFILGRIASLSDDQTWQLWLTGKQEELFQKVKMSDK